MNTWQPIETAPTTGERVLLLHEVFMFKDYIGYVFEATQIVEGWFVDGNWEPWQGKRIRCTTKLRPTHWMYKPFPPPQ